MTPEERDRLTRTETQVEAMAADIHEIKADLKRIADTLAQGRGAWRLLLAVGGLSGTVASGVTWLASHWPMGR